MKIKFLQQGGAMGGDQGAQGGGEDAAMQQISAMAQEIINQLGPEGAMVLADAITQMVQGGGGEQQPPVYQKCGGKMTPKKKKK